MVSCEYDYNIDKGFENFKPQVVVNSIITPDSVIKVDVFWSKHYTDIKSDYPKVKTFEAELYEDNVLIEKNEYKDGLMLTSIFPKEGKSYRIKITVPNYGELKAKTYIPLSVNAAADYKVTAGGGFRTYQHIEVRSIEPKEKIRSAWIKTYGEYTKKEETEILRIDWASDLYSNNIFADQINAVLDSDDATHRGSNVGYEHFMRIPYANISQSLPVAYSVWLQSQFNVRIETDDPELDEWGNPIYYQEVCLKIICVEVTSPSDDYDKYYKSIYKQELYGDSPDLPFISEMVNVHSNIENGLGIFAGRSVTLLRLTVK